MLLQAVPGGVNVGSLTQVLQSHEEVLVDGFAAPFYPPMFVNLNFSVAAAVVFRNDLTTGKSLWQTA